MRTGKKSIMQVKADFQLAASKATIWRVINNVSTLKYQKIMTKPTLIKERKQARLKFARSHMSWDQEWRSVIFSDEKKFN